jgi:hypothetical protein
MDSLSRCARLHRAVPISHGFLGRPLAGLTGYQMLIHWFAIEGTPCCSSSVSASRAEGGHRPRILFLEPGASGSTLSIRATCFLDEIAFNSSPPPSPAMGVKGAEDQ